MWNIIKIWKNKDWINPVDPYGWFQWYFRYWLGRISLDDERQINRWNGIVSRFKDKLIKQIKDVNARFDEYSISPEIRQVLFYWGYKLVFFIDIRFKSDTFWDKTFFFFKNFCSYKKDFIFV